MNELLALDKRMLLQALALARRGIGRTAPNPAVGAVIVNEGVVVGEGYHQQAGGAHAEIFALQAAGEKAHGATVYVTLEPCAHYGKTPPCAEALVRAGVARVVFASLDPNPLVAGKGVKILQQAGIIVEHGQLSSAEAHMNEAWRFWLQQHRPFITVKLAASLDGKIATCTGESRWITGEEARHDVHKLRNRQDAIITTANTVLADDPQLTTRIDNGRDARRVVLDSTLRTSPQAAVYQQAAKPPILATSIIDEVQLQPFRKLGAEVLILPAKMGHLDLLALMQALGERDIVSAMVEAGGIFAAALLQAGLVNKLRLYLAPILIGGSNAPCFFAAEGFLQLSEALRLDKLRCKSVGDDILLEGYCRPVCE